MSFDLADPPPFETLDPHWYDVDLGGGLVATLRPWTGLLESAAEATVAAQARVFLTAPAPEVWGFVAEPGDLADPDLFARLWKLIETATRASLRIERLNLRLEDGTPFPLTPYALARLFHRAVTGDGGEVHRAAFLTLEAGRAH